MKLIAIFLILLLLTPSLVNANPSDWDTFSKVKDQYYYIDKQSFNEITCNIEVPLMTRIISQVKAQLSPLKDKFEITDDLSKFAMTYSPGVGLNFSRPEFDIRLKTLEGIADPARVKNGIEITKNGFKLQVDGVIDTINGIFDDYTYPQKEKYKNLKVSSQDNGKISVSYEKEGSRVNETYSGNTIDGREKRMGGETTYKLIYGKNAANKFLVKSMTATINQPVGIIKIDSSISYQSVGQLDFPKQINSYFEQKVQSVEQKGEFEINLTNCTKN